ncbi:SEC10 [Candida oxycetoniae]|uniref:SEC10 n=1 Tax=Candida oxycetoniae TaxID=497107 RepID=A0AAI9WZX6_9ASCO|nr:SEC10 [Candida oxycetoniae]KAI3406668.2 SEC10 [Candida oxycetoniae]
MSSKFSLYESNPDVEKYVVDGSISINQFVENISKDHYLKGAEINSKAYLDPKPYIRSFESTLRELNQLNIEAKIQESKGEEQVDTFELKHSENVLGLSQQIADTTSKFNYLDNQISEVSSKISPLGMTLSKISTSRDKSQETIFLIRAYHGFYTKGNYAPLETMRSSSKVEDNVKCAKSIRHLMKLASRISDESLPSTLKCLETIKEYGQAMEDELLHLFETLLEGDEHSDGNVDIQKMNKIATILFAYNDGTNLVETFVRKSAISNEEEDDDDYDDEDEEEEEEEEDDGYGDYDEATAEEGKMRKKYKGTYTRNHPKSIDVHGDALESNPKLQNFITNTKFEIKSKARISKKVFNDPDMVLTKLIQRIFDGAIKQKVTTLLALSVKKSTLDHLKLLSSLKKLMFDFTHEIKDYLITEDFNKDGTLLLVLDQLYTSLFQEYVRDDVYLVQEKRSIEEAVGCALKKLDPETFSDQITKNDASGYELKSAENEHISFVNERKKMAQFKQYVKTKLNERMQNDRGISKLELEEDELAAIETIETLIKTVAESIGRVLEISPNKAPEHSITALSILISNFDKLSVREEVQLQSSDFFLNLYSIQFKKEVLFCLSTCAKKIIFPCLASVPVAKNKAKTLINDFVKRNEIGINELLMKTIEYSLTQTQNLLNKQKKKDFLCDKIEEDTEACEAVSAFLEEMYANISMALSGANLETFLITFGTKFLNQLLEHYMKFSVNSIGGIVLTKDVLQYQSRIDEWNIPILSEKFQILKEIGNLFTVQSDLVNSLVTEGQLSQMRPYTVRQYISKRADFNPSYADRFFKFR